MPKENNITTYRNLAQTITVGSAVATGIVWVVATIVKATDTSWLMMLQDAFVIITAVGGVTMGVLYLISRLQKK
ncbi:MAG: hypothetical protein ABIQ04_00050 [Candidatus Saccharimonadales bacterium]